MASPVPMTIAEARLTDHEYVCHAVHEPAAWSYPEHLHVDVFDFSYVHRGTVVHEVDGTRTELCDGMSILVRSGESHRLSGRGLLMYTLNFRAEALHTAAGYLGSEEKLASLLNDPKPLVFSEPYTAKAAIPHDLQRLLLEQDSQAGARRFRVFMVRWLSAHLEESEVRADAARPAWLADLELYIDEHVEDQIHLADLARHAGRTPEHIARCFRTHLGKTPTEAINAARLRRAALLLARTNRPIIDICYSLGYRSLSYFYRLFAGEFGTPPKEYRRTNSVLDRT
ncbi:MAG: helix-turn-helix domain-containing protein [Spirochaetales bacterium]